MYAPACDRAWRWPLFALLAAASLAMRWAWIGAPLDRLAVTVLPDDAFYYFEIAQQWWLGHGISFDGTAPATGMHPLWLAVVLPFFRGAGPGAAEPLHAVLVLSALIAAFGAQQIARFAWRATGHLATGAVLGLAFLANRWVVALSLNGLETTLALALLAWFACRLLDYLDAPSAGRAAGLGFVAGLCILARSDMAVLLAVPCALVLGRCRRPWHPHVLLTALFPALAVAALVLFSYAQTGALLQSSASAVPWVGQQNWLLWHPDADAWAYHKVGRETARRSIGKTFGELGALSVWVMAAAGPILAAGLLRPAWRRRGGGAPAPVRHAATVVIAVAAGLIALHFAHGYFRWIARPYYFAGWAWVAFAAPAAALRMALPRALDELAAARYATLPARGLAAALIAFLAAQLVLAARPHLHYPWQIEMLRAGEMLRSGEGLPGHFTHDAPAGAFNAALIAYVNARPIVNLDGVVDEDALRAIRSGRLAEYMDARGVRIVADFPAMWAGRTYFATLAPWFYPNRGALPHRAIMAIDHPGAGFPKPENRIEVIEVNFGDTILNSPPPGAGIPQRDQAAN